MQGVKERGSLLRSSMDPDDPASLHTGGFSPIQQEENRSSTLCLIWSHGALERWNSRHYRKSQTAGMTAFVAKSCLVQILSLYSSTTSPFFLAQSSTALATHRSQANNALIPANAGLCCPVQACMPPLRLCRIPCASLTIAGSVPGPKKGAISLRVLIPG